MTAMAPPPHAYSDYGHPSVDPSLFAMPSYARNYSAFDMKRMNPYGHFYYDSPYTPHAFPVFAYGSPYFGYGYSKVTQDLPIKQLPPIPQPCVHPQRSPLSHLPGPPSDYGTSSSGSSSGFLCSPQSLPPPPLYQVASAPWASQNLLQAGNPVRSCPGKAVCAYCRSVCSESACSAGTSSLGGSGASGSDRQPHQCLSFKSTSASSDSSPGGSPTSPASGNLCDVDPAVVFWRRGSVAGQSSPKFRRSVTAPVKLPPSTPHTNERPLPVPPQSSSALPSSSQTQDAPSALPRRFLKDELDIGKRWPVSLSKRKLPSCLSRQIEDAGSEKTLKPKESVHRTTDCLQQMRHATEPTTDVLPSARVHPSKEKFGISESLDLSPTECRETRRTPSSTRHRVRPSWRRSPPPASSLPSPSPRTSSKAESYAIKCLKEQQVLCKGMSSLSAGSIVSPRPLAGQVPFDPRPSTLPEVNSAWTRSPKGHVRLLNELRHTYPHDFVDQSAADDQHQPKGSKFVGSTPLITPIREDL